MCFNHKGVEYVAKYQVDDVNQRIELKGIFLQAQRTHNIIDIVSDLIVASLVANIETRHLTHSA